MSKTEIVSVIGRQVLDSRGNPTVEAEVRLACGTVGIHARSGLERKLGRHLQECLDPALARLDGGKGSLGHLGSGKVAGGNARGDPGGGKGIEALRHYSLSPSPKMDGTRK